MTFFIQLVSASKPALGSNWCKKQRDTRGRSNRRGEGKRAPSVPPTCYVRWPTINCHGKNKNLNAKTKYFTAKRNRKAHGKNKIPLTTKPKPSRQNQRPHGKTKDLTAKPNTSQQKPNTSRQKHRGTQRQFSGKYLFGRRY